MNMHTQMSPDRHLLPRSLLPRRPAGQFAFIEGYIVDHIDGGMVATVVARGRTAAGVEIYALEMEDKGDDRVRVMRGPWLVSASKQKHS
tara:strand:- start:1386 stop:1652 length:267 start_codon:yes stop_codon:yes gene_type:complete